MDGKLHAQKGPTYKNKQTGSRLVARHSISGPGDSKTLNLQAFIVFGSSGFVLIDKSNKDIKLIDSDFKVIDSLQLKTRPFDLCMANRSISEFYVTEPEAEVVHCIKVHKNKMKVKRSMVIDEDCRGITCWKSGLAVSVMIEGFTGTLGVLDYDCNISRKTWQTDIGTRLFRAPWYLSSNCEGNNIVVSDQGNHSVICIEALTLHIVFVLKNADLHGPRSVVCDLNDNIYVIGSSERCHNVVKISRTGKLVDILLSRGDKLNYPSGLAFSPNDNTILLQANRERPLVSVYEI